MLDLTVLGVLAAFPGAGTTANELVPRQATPLAIQVDRIVAPDGAIGPGGWIVIRGERIEAVGAGSPPSNAQTLVFAGATACPGFIDPVTSLGASGDLVEPTRPFTPQVQAGDAFHPDHSGFRDAARGGITTVGLSPGSTNVIGGVVAVVRTSGPDGLAILGGAGPMRLTLTSDAFDRSREPTSRIGALPKLREMLQTEEMRRAEAFVIDASTPDEIRLALETAAAPGRSIALWRPQRADDALELVKGSGAVALLGPYGFDDGERDLHLPALLAEAGVPVAFTSGGSAAGLRLTAALATREGLSQKAALQALTSVPARVLGVEADCGSLEAGKRADLVVFRGNPLDLAAKIELVLVGGHVVEPKKSNHARETSR
jgi:imidazolonepropionase-like amidohydrolase